VSTGRRTEGGASLADPVMQIANVNLLGGAAAVWPLAAPAQQPRVSQHRSPDRAAYRVRSLTDKAGLEM